MKGGQEHEAVIIMESKESEMCQLYIRITIIQHLFYGTLKVLDQWLAFLNANHIPVMSYFIYIFWSI